MNISFPAPRARCINDDPNAVSRAQREAIDLVATLRARSLRLALLVSMSRDVGTENDWVRADLEAQLGSITAITEALTGLHRLPDVSADLSDWIVGIAGKDAPFIRTMTELRKQSAALVAALDTPEGAKQLVRLIPAYTQFAIGPMFEAVTRFCDHSWEALDTARVDDLERATQIVASMGKRLSRLEHIGKHVRLVSLNASVEASRAGNAGRGLLVIAQEFKTLAEEIQTLAAHSRQEMNGL